MIGDCKDFLNTTDVTVDKSPRDIWDKVINLIKKKVECISVIFLILLLDFSCYHYLLSVFERKWCDWIRNSVVSKTLNLKPVHLVIAEEIINGVVYYWSCYI